MSKLKKLIKNPRKFLEDSVYLGYGKVDKVSEVDNIFVVSTYAQLKNIENLIELENLYNNFLIILYTKNNLRMPKLMEKKLNREKFKKIVKLRLPNKPGNITLNKIRYYIQSYYFLFENISPKNLYLFSFQGHYTILKKIAEQKKVKIILVEEGTASYKNAVEVEVDGFIKSIEKKIIQKIPYCNQVYKRFDKVDVIYSAFPDVMCENFSAKKNYTFLHPFFSTLNENIDDFKNLYNITNNDIVFVNQKYNINVDDHVKAVLQILNKLVAGNGCKIFIKMHPNDSDKMKERFRELAAIISDEIIIIEEGGFLIESLISIAQPKMLVGLTSTSLVYSPLVSSSTKSISIARSFVDLVRLNNNDGCKLILEHLDILKSFNNIYEYYDDLFNLMNLNLNLTGSNKFDNYLFFYIMGELDFFNSNYFEDHNLDYSEASFNYMLPNYGASSKFKNICFSEILNKKNMDCIDGDNGLLSKYFIFKENFLTNKYKSFYYLNLIKLEIGFLPQKLINDYIFLVFENNLAKVKISELIDIVKNNSHIVSSENSNRLLAAALLSNSFKFFDACLTTSYQIKLFDLFKAFLRGKENFGLLSIDDLDENQYFLLIFFNILYLLNSDSNANFEFSYNHIFECDNKNEIFRICYDVLEKKEMYKVDFTRKGDNNAYDVFYMLLEISIVRRFSIGDLKSKIIKYEKQGYDFSCLNLFMMDVMRLNNNYDKFCGLFEDSLTFNHYISPSNVKYYLSDCSDILKITKLISSLEMVLKNFMLYYILVVKFIDLYVLFNNEQIFIFFKKYESIEFNHQILTDGYFYDDIASLEVFKKYFQF